MLIGFQILTVYVFSYKCMHMISMTMGFHWQLISNTCFYLMTMTKNYSFSFPTILYKHFILHCMGRSVINYDLFSSFLPVLKYYMTLWCVFCILLYHLSL